MSCIFKNCCNKPQVFFGKVKTEVRILINQNPDPLEKKIAAFYFYLCSILYMCRNYVILLVIIFSLELVYLLYYFFEESIHFQYQYPLHKNISNKPKILILIRNYLFFFS
jgi:hypothetical protein